VTTRAVIAMSGGVDSSVAAALLKQQGYDVVGLMLRLWSEPGSDDSCSLNRCCSPEAVEQARRVAELLDIPFYVIDAQALFKTRVVDHFVASYAAGLTPNPCLECNRHVRWDFLLKKALSLDAQYLATGHYARIRTLAGAGGDTCQLLKGSDEKKDQSYVLSVMRQEHLAHALFPVGDYTKAQVRALARGLQLPVAERPESQDLCFLADGDYRRFIQEQAPEAVRPGPITLRDGRVVGAHTGLPFYTIGQRKGIGVAGPEPLYVIETHPESNTLVVGTRAELGRSRLMVAAVNWISGAPPAAPMRALVKIRYKANPVWATVTPGADGADELHPSASVDFDAPVRDITPGQAAVFYEGEVCLGGGVITR
jgi:tRNA-specific 2-thiouridylase